MSTLSIINLSERSLSTEVWKIILLKIIYFQCRQVFHGNQITCLASNDFRSGYFAQFVTPLKMNRFWTWMWNDAEISNDIQMTFPFDVFGKFFGIKSILRCWRKKNVPFSKDFGAFESNVNSTFKLLSVQALRAFKFHIWRVNTEFSSTCLISLRRRHFR